MTTAVIGESQQYHVRFTEIDLVHNPSFGAYLLWCGSQGYFGESQHWIPLPLTFLLLPLLLHAPTKNIIASTYKPSGLTLFAAKLGEHQEDLLAVHRRALILRELTFRSLSLACTCKMLVVESRSAMVLPIEIVKKPSVSDDVKRIGDCAEKLGAWFSRLPMEQVATTLRIEF